jgi:RNA polymerase sigma-70 factor (ECF subfamily)
MGTRALVADADALDTALMARFRDTHDPAAFERLHRQASGRVLAWVRRLLNERQSSLDPLEICQDTFVNVYRYSRRFRDESPSSFRVWVRTIASNCVRRALSVRPGGGSVAGLEEAADCRPGPPGRFQDREEALALTVAWLLFLEHYARAYDGLSPRDRTALHRVEIEGESYAHVARRLRVGSSNMKMIMFRARQRLLRGMQRSMGGAQELCAAPSDALG